MSAGRQLSILQELFRARLRAIVDPRTTPCSLEILPKAGKISFCGFGLNSQVCAAVRNLAVEIYAGRNLDFSRLQDLSRCLPTFVRVGWKPVPFFRHPRVDIPDTLTTALPGTILRVFLRSPGFLLVQHPDGYVGYIDQSQVQPARRSDYLAWRNGPTAYVASVLTFPRGRSLPAGTKLTLRTDGRVVLPDGSASEMRGGNWEVRDPASASRTMIEAVEALLPEYAGTPYLWGGKTEVGTDCSGFVQTVAGRAGIALPRDASMQCHVGDLVGILKDFRDLLPGDIVFFMNQGAFVYHVGIWLGQQRFVHSSRQFGGVVVSSMDPGGEKHSPQYATDFCYARRIGRL